MKPADVRDRDLIRLYWRPELRPAFDTLMALDDRLAEVALGASQPALGAIKLAWWRDSLAALDTQPPPPEPLLMAVASELLPLGLTGAILSGLPAGWMALLDESEEPEPRGRALFGLLGTLLGIELLAGDAFARADLARRTGERRWMIPMGKLVQVPARARPATLLDALARRDLERSWPPEPEATPGRGWTLLRHRITGR